MVRLFGTSFSVDVGSIRLNISIGLEDRAAEPVAVRIEDLPRFEIGSK